MRKKPLTQISFDFDAPAPTPAPEPAPAEETIVNTPVVSASEQAPAAEPVQVKTSVVVDFGPSIQEPASVGVVASASAPASIPTIEPESVLKEIDASPSVGIRNVKIKRPLATATGKRGRKSIKEIESRVDLVQVPDDEELFKKQYYTIGEVATMFSEKQSLIRYWESEFDILQPRKNRKGDRYFRPIDIKNLVLIYDLLRRRKFTIDGARDFLKKNKKAEERFALIQSLQKLRGFLQELRSNL
jgi:DNA-binding transcriptional MerR regulator